MRRKQCNSQRKEKYVLASNIKTQKLDNMVNILMYFENFSKF